MTTARAAKKTARPLTSTATVAGREMTNVTPREAALLARLYPGRVIVACNSDR